MKTSLLCIAGLLSVSFVLNSCEKQEYFKSESSIKSDLMGTWDLIPIPRYDIINGDSIVHTENWTFNDTKVTIVNYTQTGYSDYSVHTSWTKAEFKLDHVSPVFTSPARVRNIDGTWQIVKLDGQFLIIANDQSGGSGVTELEFKKR